MVIGVVVRFRYYKKPVREVTDGREMEMAMYELTTMPFVALVSSISESHCPEDGGKH